MMRPEMPCEFHAFANRSRAEREAEWLDRAVRLLQAAFPGAVLEEKEAA